MRRISRREPAVTIVQVRECGGIARGDTLPEPEVDGIVTCIARVPTILARESTGMARLSPVGERGFEKLFEYLAGMNPKRL